jgi:disulfide bond formation protein DsbB
MDALTNRRLLAAATLVATVATLGSLNYSLGMGLFPCRLCWYQRIFMYPLTGILGVATLTEQYRVYQTALPLAIPGWAIAAYHSYLQRWGPDTCAFMGCSDVQYELGGVLTIPNQSLLGFTLILAAMGVLWYRARKSPQES